MFDTVAGVPQGNMLQFEIDSKQSELRNPGIARKESGKADPHNPKTLSVEAQNTDYKRKITVGISAHYKLGSAAPFMVVDDSPMRNPSMEMPHVLGNLIGQK